MDQHCELLASAWENCGEVVDRMDMAADRLGLLLDTDGGEGWGVGGSRKTDDDGEREAANNRWIQAGDDDRRQARWKPGDE